MNSVVKSIKPNRRAMTYCSDYFGVYARNELWTRFSIDNMRDRNTTLEQNVWVNIVEEFQSAHFDIGVRW